MDLPSKLLTGDRCSPALVQGSPTKKPMNHAAKEARFCRKPRWNMRFSDNMAFSGEARRTVAWRRVGVMAVVTIAVAMLPGMASAKPFTDYFKPTPIVCPPTSNIWGDKAVVPRDTCNGLEDTTGTPTVRPKWMYWDGKILRGADGKSGSPVSLRAHRLPIHSPSQRWTASCARASASRSYLGAWVRRILP
jgi:hypothetical protein